MISRYYFFVMTEDFGADCDENFKRVVGCLKKAVKGMKEAFDSDAPGKHSSVGGL
jgi:hypothetical protein